MKKIHLHAPSVTNAGTFIDAGSDLAVGTGPTAIAADRAAHLVSTRQAIEVKARPGAGTKAAKPKANKRAPAKPAKAPAPTEIPPLS